jgi:hypothetical protein
MLGFEIEFEGRFSLPTAGRLFFMDPKTLEIGMQD